MKKELLFVAAFLWLASVNVSAGTMGEAHEFYNNFITLSGGPAWTTNGRSQIINLEDDLVKAYAAQKKKSTLGTGEVFFGLQKEFNPYLIYQLGLAIAGSSYVKLAGSIWDEANPLFDNFFYNYKVKQTRITAKGKLLADIHYWAQPYVSGSLGLGFNQSYGFNTLPKTVEQLTPPGFNGHTRTNFTYTLGTGLQRAINSRWSVGLGYEFADWGKSNLASTIAQQIGGGLKLKHLYTHELQFSLSFNI